jgi:hypothetical protein
MVNASGMRPAQRDQGEARRNDVISRPFRRLRLCSLIISMSYEKFTSLSPFFAFFRLYLVEIVVVKTAPL